MLKFLSLMPSNAELFYSTGPLLPDGAPIQRLSGDEDDVSSIPSPTSSEETSPQRGSFQNGESKTLSLIQRKSLLYNTLVNCTFLLKENFTIFTSQNQEKR